MPQEIESGSGALRCERGVPERRCGVESTRPNSGWPSAGALDASRTLPARPKWSGCTVGHGAVDTCPGWPCSCPACWAATGGWAVLRRPRGVVAAGRSRMAPAAVWGRWTLSSVSTEAGKPRLRWWKAGRYAMLGEATRRQDSPTTLALAGVVARWGRWWGPGRRSARRGRRWRRCLRRAGRARVASGLRLRRLWRRP